MGVAAEPAGLHPLAHRVEEPEVSHGLAAHGHPEAMVPGDDAAGQVPAVAVAEKDQRAGVSQAPGREQVHAGQDVADLRVRVWEPAVT